MIVPQLARDLHGNRDSDHLPACHPIPHVRLTTFIKGSDARQREAAAESLVIMGEMAVEGLAHIVKEDVTDAAARAAEVLGKIGSPTALAALTDDPMHPFSQVRRSAACHGVHSGNQAKHIFTGYFDGWGLPIFYTVTPGGGS